MEVSQHLSSFESFHRIKFPVGNLYVRKVGCCAFYFDFFVVYLDASDTVETRTNVFLCLCLGRRISNTYFAIVVITHTSSECLLLSLMGSDGSEVASAVNCESSSAFSSDISVKNNSSNFCLVISMKLEIAINQNIFDIIWHHQLNYIKKNWISYPCEVGVLNAIDFSDDSFKLKWLKACWQNPKRTWQCVPSSTGFEQIESLQILLKSTDLPSCFLQSMKQLLWEIMEIDAWAALVYFWLHMG